MDDELALHFMGEQQAIVKFILQDENGDAIYPTTLTFYGDNLLLYYDNITFDYSYAGGDGLVLNSLPYNTNEIYVALRLQSACGLILHAETEDGLYIYTKDSASFESGKYHEVTVTMTKKS